MKKLTWTFRVAFLATLCCCAWGIYFDACRPTPASPEKKPSLDLPAIMAAVAKADSLPAEQVFQIAQSLPGGGAAQDTFYTHFLDEKDAQMDVKALRENLPFFQRLRGGNPGADAFYHYRRSGVFFLEDSVSAAEQSLRRALKIAETLPDTPFRLHILSNLGSTLEAQGKNADAFPLRLQTLNMASALGDSTEIANANFNLACAHNNNKDFREALKPARKALSFFQKTGDLNSASTCCVLLSCASFKVLDTASAFVFAEKAIEIREKIHDAPPNLVEAYRHEADLWAAVRDFPKSRKAIEKALFWHEKQPIPYWEPSLYCVAGTSFFKTGDTERSKQYLLASIKTAQQSGQMDMEETSNLQLAHLFEETGRPAESLRHLWRYKILHDSLFSAEKERIIHEFNIKYETAQKERQFAEARQQHELARQQFFVALLGVVLALLLTLFLFVRQRDKRRLLEKEKQLLLVNETLQRQKLEQSEANLKTKSGELDEANALLAFKNQLIADLQLKTSTENTASSPADAPGNEQLEHLKTLTDSGWLRVKNKFDHLFPGFVQRLKSTFPSLTPAETRLFILIKIGFDIPETADVLGISTSSVWTSRSRLKTKLGLSDNQNLDVFIHEFA